MMRKPSWVVCFLVVLFALSTKGNSQAVTTNPTAELLAQLIRIDSTIPPGEDVKITELLTATLSPLGFQIETIPTPVPGKVHFLARLKKRIKEANLARRACRCGRSRAGGLAYGSA